MVNYAGTERLPQGTDCTAENLHDIYEEASAFAGRVLGSMQTLAGTTSCKGVQIAELEKWAQTNNCWIESPESLGTFADRGSENEVFVSKDGTEMFKLNDFRYSDDNLTPFFDRLKAHNYYFPNCSYMFIGMSKNREGNTCAVLVQPFVVAEREATEEEVSREMEKLGFHAEYDGECYSNGVHDIYDASPNNVLVGVDGRLYFIDTIIYNSSKDSIKTYRSQSPKFNLGSKAETGKNL